MRKPGILPAMHVHVGRAWDIAEKKLPPWQWPSMSVEVDGQAFGALRCIQDDKDAIGVDVETMGTEPMTAPLMCIGVASSSFAVSLPWAAYGTNKWGDVKGLTEYVNGGDYAAKLVDILEDPEIPKVLQNGQHDILSLESVGIKLANYSFDTMLAHAVVAPQMPHDLGLMCAIEFHAPRWKSEFRVLSDAKGADSFVQRDPAELRIYNAKDAWMTRMLMEPLQERIRGTHNGGELFSQYMQLARVAIRMRRRGIQVETGNFERHRSALTERRAGAKRELEGIAAEMGASEPYNPNSPKQQAWLFFDRFDVTPTKFSEITGAPSLDEQVLQKIAIHPNPKAGHAAKETLKFRKAQKLLRTYVEGLPIDKNNVIHPTWRVDGARTGRWSSTEPAAQTIPPVMRNLFKAREGRWICEADFSQLELRILALLSQDEKLSEWYAQGIDVHTKNAQELFGVEEPTKEQRQLAKREVYGMSYGGDAETIWSSLVVDFPQLTIGLVEELMRRWYKAHPQIAAFQKRNLRQAKENGFVEAPLSGRRYYFYGPVEPTKVYNFPIQTTAADIINPACLKLDSALDWETESILFQVHDSLICEGPDLLSLCDRMKDALESEVTFGDAKVTFPIDFKVGTNWGTAEEMEWDRIEKLAERGTSACGNSG
jgi:DNA polymerase-1